MRAKLTRGIGVLAAVAVMLVGLASAGDALAKGEPTTPSKCDKLKKNSPEWKRCVGQAKDDLSDNELYYAGYWLSRVGSYREAVDYLARAKVKDERILTYLGFATRKLGNHESAMRYYERAITLNPAYTVVRAYLGEAMVERGDLAAAREQLAAIESVCGAACADYRELARQIGQHEATRHH